VRGQKITNAALSEIVTAIYEQHIGGTEEFTYPIVGEQLPTLQVADRDREKDNYAN